VAKMLKEYFEVNKKVKGGVSKSIDTSRGIILVRGPVSAEELIRMVPDEGLNMFRPPQKQLKALVEIASLPEGFVFVAHLDQLLIGYVTFHPPEEFERWGQGNLKEIMELGAIEVSPAWRGFGIASKLLETAFETGIFEDYIVISTEYYWHWDCARCDLDIWEYQDMIKHLFGKVGLLPVGTNDPEITCHPANMLAARIGSRVKPETIEEFKCLRYA